MMLRKNVLVCMAILLAVVAGSAFARKGALIVHQPGELGLTKITIATEIYDKVSLPRLMYTMTPGEPELPMQLVYLVIPKDQKVVDVNVVSSAPEPLAGNFNVYPVQQPVPIGGDAPPFTPPNPDVYESNEQYPGKLVSVTGDGYMGDYHIVSLVVYPVQYLPAEKRLVYYNSIDFNLITSSGVDGSVQRARVTEKAAALNADMVKKLVANPQDVAIESAKVKIQRQSKAKGAVMANPVKITALPSEQSSPVEYLIITSEALKAEFERLSEWKNNVQYTELWVIDQGLNLAIHGVHV